MSTTVRCAGFDLTISPATPADATHVVRAIASGRFLTGTPKTLGRAVRRVKGKNGTVIVVKASGSDRPWAVVGGIISGKLLPTMNLTIAIDPRAGPFVASVVVKAVTETVIEALRKNKGNGALTCDASQSIPMIEDILTKNGWTSTQTVSGGLRRFVLL